MRNEALLVFFFPSDCSAFPLLILQFYPFFFSSTVLLGSEKVYGIGIQGRQRWDKVEAFLCLGFFVFLLCKIFNLLLGVNFKTG